ncbi:hypothetical protein [Acidilobus sp.]|uniref:hypothetical protein n=1 Tax=Acidilobus sp. TaxID=1872109 RepID=UPI003CFE224F
MSNVPIIIRQGAELIRDLMTSGIGGLIDYFNKFCSAAATPSGRLCDVMARFTMSRQYLQLMGNIGIEINDIVRYSNEVYGLIYESDFNDSVAESRRLAEGLSACFMRTSEMVMRYANALLDVFRLCGSCGGAEAGAGPLVKPFAEEEVKGPLRYARDLANNLSALGEVELLNRAGLTNVDIMSGDEACGRANLIDAGWVNSLIRRMAKVADRVIDELTYISELANKVERGLARFSDLMAAVNGCPHLS